MVEVFSLGQLLQIFKLSGNFHKFPSGNFRFVCVHVFPAIAQLATISYSTHYWLQYTYRKSPDRSRVPDKRRVPDTGRKTSSSSSWRRRKQALRGLCIREIDVESHDNMIMITGIYGKYIATNNEYYTIMSCLLWKRVERRRHLAGRRTKLGLTGI